MCAAIISSCSDFLAVYPENEISSEEFLSTEKDMEIYSNGFLQRYLPDAIGTAYADQYADNIVTRSSTTFLIGDSWRPEDQGTWGGGAGGKWAQLRDANWFLDHITKGKGNVSKEVYDHYEGVGRFWRAYFYYDMVRTFGDVPWYDHELDVNDEEGLFKRRDSREFVMDKVLEDLNFASTHCSADNKMTTTSTRITRWVALAFKARVCLFEGTYRKYHTELNLGSSAEKFLREAISACLELMESPYQLATGDVKTIYRSLFTNDNLNETEVIWGIAYKTDVRMHNLTWYTLSASAGASWSLTKQFVNQYLMTDGSRFTEKNDYQKIPFDKEFEGRDNRLQQTVISPDYQRMINRELKKVAPDVWLSGYQLIKWIIDDDKHVGLSTSANSLPLFRYAETLLTYAEAKAELGEMNEEIWNQTIRPLRARAGVNGAVPATYDPYLADYYRNQTTDKWILEIRRERSVELACERVRYDDIMRWKLGELLAMDWQGVYIAKKDEGYDLNGDGTIDLTVSDTGSASSTRVVLGSAYKLSDGDSGNLVYNYNLGRLWLDKKYLRPIPASAIQLNPELGQNPGW
jgi:hypothetical protein